MSRLFPATLVFQGYFRQHQGFKPFKDLMQIKFKWLWIWHLQFSNDSLKYNLLLYKYPLSYFFNTYLITYLTEVKQWTFNINDIENFNFQPDLFLRITNQTMYVALFLNDYTKKAITINEVVYVNTFIKMLINLIVVVEYKRHATYYNIYIYLLVCSLCI